MRLADRIAAPDGKRRYVRSLFATIADRYDFITVALSYGQDRRWKRRLVELAKPAPGAPALDLATGTGDIAFALAARGANVVGLDITHRMIALANAKVARRPRGEAASASLAGARVYRRRTEAGGFQPSGDRSPARRPFDTLRVVPSIEGRHAQGIPSVSRDETLAPRFLVGDMLALPFPSESFDLVTAGYGLRNVPNLTLAVDEIRRVLRPGGQLLSLDFNRPSNAAVRTAYLAYLTVVGSTLGWLLHRDPDTYRYIPASIRQYPGAEAVARLLETRGFARATYHRVLGGLMAIHHAFRS